MNTFSVEEIRKSMTPMQRNLILIGCMLLLCFMASSGLALATLQPVMLDDLQAGELFSLVTVLAALGTCLFTPVGGRLSDMIGTKNIMLFGGGVAVIATLLLPLLPNFWLFMIARFLISAGSGLFVAAPFTLVREIFPVEQVPAKMGLLTAAIGLGSLIGGVAAGFFADMGWLYAAITFPVLFALAGGVIVLTQVPNKHAVKEPFDWIGFITLSIGLTMVFVGLNEAPKLGWDHPGVLIGLLGGLAVLAVFVWWENKADYPLIPLRLFANKEFSVLLWIGFLSYFYLNAMNVYIPLGMQKVMEASNTASGSLQMPRTVITMILPALLGVWIVKKHSHTTMALALSAIFVLIPFAALVFIGPKMPIWFVTVMVALTGVAESYRSVSITPVAQSLLKPADLGIGTSLLSFFNALSGVISGSVDGLAYDALHLNNPGVHGITMGLDTVFLITAGLALICLLLVLFVFRPMYNHRLQAKSTK